MIPEPRWLRNILSHLLKNPQAALGTPLQHFYNISTTDRLGMIFDIRGFESLVNLQDCVNEAYMVAALVFEGFLSY